MNLQTLRASLFFGALALMVGCGASPGGTGNGPVGSPTVVTFTITGVTPTAVATKVGSGPFTPATLTSGVVTLTLPSGVSNFAVAYTCSVTFPPSGTGPSVEVDQEVYEATTLDGTAFTGPCLAETVTVPPSTLPSGEFTGSVDASAIPRFSVLDVSASNNDYGAAFGFSSATANFDFEAPTGSDRVRLLAYNNVTAPPAPAGITLLAAAKTFDNQVVPGALNGGKPVVLTPADETTLVPVTVGSLPPGFTLEEVVANLASSDGSMILASPATTHYPALPAGATESGEYYSIRAEGYNGTAVTSITKTSLTAVPIAFTFPAGWFYAGPSPASKPTFDLAYPGFTGTDGMSYYVSGSWEPAGSGEDHFILIHATGNYLGSGTPITWPDLSGVTGLLSPPASGSTVFWGASITQTTYMSQPASLDNATVTTVANSGRYIVP